MNETRRNSLKTAAVLSAAAGLSGVAQGAPNTKAVKVALVGCGGRGKNDLRNVRKACEILGLDFEVVALADAFVDCVQKAGEEFGVPAGQQFTGFDSYHQVAQSDAEFVLLVTPPLFRATQLEAMLKAGKHCFIEKPVAVDAPGCRKVIELGAFAQTRRLGVSAGMQRRHSAGYRRNAAKIQAGAIGPILGGTVSWNGTVPWIYERRDGWSDAEYLARNWVNWTEMSGDHIVEQHVHNIDVANWFIGRVPKSAVGFGGRARRVSGNQFDFFSVDLDYGDNVHIHSQCRQMSGAFQRVGEELRGADGVVFGGGKLVSDKKVRIQEPVSDSDNDGVQEMVDMVRAVRGGQPINEARIVAEATGVAIMGRISCYTGQMVRWTDLFENEDSEWYNFSYDVTAQAFENGTVKMPAENVAPVPGDGGKIHRR